MGKDKDDRDKKDMTETRVVVVVITTLLLENCIKSVRKSMRQRYSKHFISKDRK